MADIPDDLSTTTTLRLNENIDSDLTTGDYDLIRVNLTEGQRYRFDLFGGSTGAPAIDPLLALFDDRLNLLSIDDDGGDNLNSRIDFTAGRSGTFYIATTSIGGPGTYRLSMVTGIDVPDDFAQTRATTGRLSLTNPAGGSVSFDGDQDWFAITLSADQTYRFGLTGRSDTLAPLSDPSLSIYGTDGTYLAGNDDESGASFNSSLLFTPTASGTYYVSAASLAGERGAYRLTAETTAYDIPDTVDTNVTLPVGGSIDSTIASEEDIDALRVQLVAGQQYVIDMRGASSGAGTLSDPGVLLIDPSLELVADNDDFGGGRDAQIRYTAPVSGTYFLGAFATDGSTGSYRLSIQAVGTQPPTLPGAVTDDFNGNRFSDILFQNTNGSVSTWSSLGNGFQQNSYFASVSSSWNVVETFDMNGDGRSDILWRNTDGTVAAWQANGAGASTAFNQGSYLAGSPGAAWKIAATGDITGDNRDDILWRNDDGSISAWASNGTGFNQNSYFHSSVGVSWKVAGLGDFNGDNRDDILWRNDNGAMSIWQASGTGFAENSYFDSSVPSSWHIDGVADLNGDGRDDLVWRNDNGALSTWLASGGGFTKNAYFTGSVGNDWQIAQTADYNADGRADLLWRNGNGAISIWQSNGTGFDQNSFFNSGPSTTWQIQAHEFVL